MINYSEDYYTEIKFILTYNSTSGSINSVELSIPVSERFLAGYQVRVSISYLVEVAFNLSGDYLRAEVEFYSDGIVTINKDLSFFAIDEDILK